ncbi:hypothetical protein F4824DRAFT_498982 [Ustulina deusta]|nr:hypothetical protein F4824DRAFT_506980 [Ustulina deusta]KAI3338620.1 hypothetical protein F4824DRAFT_498982 [Ustulina deusta]
MSRRRSVGPLFLEQAGTEPKASTTTEPQNIMHSHQMSQPLTPVTQKPVVQVGLHILKQLRPYIAQAHIDSGNWNKFRITCGQLDLSWKSENGGGFLRLITSEKMQQLANQYGFDRMKDLHPDPRHPFHNSVAVAHHLNRHLFSVYQNDFLANRSKWNFRDPDDWEAPKLRYFPSDEKWQVEYILGVRDGGLPHINCTLLEAEELKENTLMFSEVWSILMLTLLFLRHPQNEKYEVVPVTVVTISGTTFRVVQGFIDGKAGSVRIHKSGVMPLGPDKKSVEERMMLIVRWVLAEPVWPSKH